MRCAECNTKFQLSYRVYSWEQDEAKDRWFNSLGQAKKFFKVCINKNPAMSWTIDEQSHCQKCYDTIEEGIEHYDPLYIERT